MKVPAGVTSLALGGTIDRMSTQTPYERLYSDTIASVVSVYVTDRTERGGGTGSGFVYDVTDDGGYLLTNHHVVGDASAVDVRLGPSSGALVGCEETRTVRGRTVPVGGDVIVGIDGRDVRSHEELMCYLLLHTEPHEPIGVRLIRDGVEIDEELTLGERPGTDGRVPVA